MIKKEEKGGNMLSDKSTFRQHCIMLPKSAKCP